VQFEVDAPDPVPFGFQPLDHVTADEATGSIHENLLGFHWFISEEGSVKQVLRKNEKDKLKRYLQCSAESGERHRSLAAEAQ
jgi:hypothetical protein